jgi:hypothetical protein
MNAIMCARASVHALDCACIHFTQALIPTPLCTQQQQQQQQQQQELPTSSAAAMCKMHLNVPAITSRKS